MPSDTVISKRIGALASWARIPAHTNTSDVRLDIHRLLDLTLAGSLLLFVSPMLVLIALAVKLQDGGPILFKQVRLGRHGRPFVCLKMRTMAPNAEAQLEALLAVDAEARQDWASYRKLKNDPRTTRLGRLLRKSSLDELPQFLNVLRGDMSVVGPRPIVDAEAVNYGRHFRHYCAVRPGITGLWQINGRNNTNYRRRVALDVLYVRSRSVRLDLAILVSTVPAVLLRNGSY